MKCTKCGTELKVVGDPIVLEDRTVLVCWRCEECWLAHNYFYTQPYLSSTNLDEPRLVCMSGDNTSRYKYFKCSTPTSDVFTLVAKRKLATRARLEAMGFTVEEPEEGLPAYRLYELV